MGHSLAAIQKQRESFDKEGFEKRILHYDNGGVVQDFTYYIFPQGMAPDLPYFAFAMAVSSLEEARHPVSNNGAALFGVSDLYPEKYREFAVYHEISEYFFGQLDCNDRCAVASDKEIKLVMATTKLTKAEKQEYIAIRLQFFKDLVKYYEKKEDTTAETLQRFAASIPKFQEAFKSFTP